jgi:hypothetical protein
MKFANTNADGQIRHPEAMSFAVWTLKFSSAEVCGSNGHSSALSWEAGWAQAATTGSSISPFSIFSRQSMQ